MKSMKKLFVSMVVLSAAWGTSVGAEPKSANWIGGTVSAAVAKVKISESLVRRMLNYPNNWIRCNARAVKKPSEKLPIIFVTERSETTHEGHETTHESHEEGQWSYILTEGLISQARLDRDASVKCKAFSGRPKKGPRQFFFDRENEKSLKNATLTQVFLATKHAHTTEGRVGEAQGARKK